MSSLEFWQLCSDGDVKSAYDIIAEGKITHYNLGLTAGCRHKHPEIIRMMIELGAQYCGECGKSPQEHVCD